MAPLLRPGLAKEAFWGNAVVIDGSPDSIQHLITMIRTMIRLPIR
jgi:hypothetical protein